MRIVLTGATGLLGKYLLEQKPGSVELFCIGRREFDVGATDCQSISMDILDFQDLEAVLNTLRPDVIINAAAEGSVDIVQGSPDSFEKINVDLPVLLSKLAFESGSHFIQISSNAVFSGLKSPYADTDPLSPINDYGALKAAAEHSVSEVNHEALILRPILMYGWPRPGGRSNPVAFWIDSLKSGREVQVVDDVWTEPLAAWDCARVVWRGIELGSAGPVNVSGGKRMSLFEFARLTAQVFELDTEKIQAISSESLPQIAPRPVDTSFSLTRMKGEFGISPTAPRQGLEQLKIFANVEMRSSVE